MTYVTPPTAGAGGLGQGIADGHRALAMQTAQTLCKNILHQMYEDRVSWGNVDDAVYAYDKVLSALADAYPMEVLTLLRKLHAGGVL
jgi:hypothetical protein